MQTSELGAGSTGTADNGRISRAMSESISLPSDRIYHELVKAGNSWADCDAAANALEEARKSVLAQISLGMEATSIAGQERAALASSAYTEHLDKMVEARKLANRARVRYDAIRTLAELRRSEESTRRAEASIR